MKDHGVFIITGGSRGLGAAIASAAHKAGFPVALVARNQRDLATAKRAMETENPGGAPITIHSVDLTKKAAVEGLFVDIKERHGAIRALVNNAATWMGTSESLAKVDESDIRRSMDANFFSAFHCAQSLLRLLKKNAVLDLAIVNVGATASLDAWPEVLPFCVAKGALRAYSKALAREYGPKGVHVAHLVIDGMLDNARTKKLNPKLKADRFLRTEAVAQSVVQIALQDRSCWTFEWDVRPYNENW